MRIFRRLDTSVLNEYNEAIRLNPDSAEAYFKRGLARALLDPDPVSFADYDEAIRLNPNYAEAYFHRACLRDYLALREFLTSDRNAGLRSAISDLDEVIRLDPNFPYLSDTYYRRGNAKYNLDQYEAAIADYDEALKIDPGAPGILAERQDAEDILNFYEEGIEELNEQIRQNPADVKTYKIRGETKGFLGRMQEAKADFQKILELTTDTDIIAEIERHLQELNNQDYWQQYSWRTGGYSEI
ncbi:MAG: tetratricopeptide repeat protein [Candidatus Poribacteria bacterium]|nr:tetratricopeptide repeat protein [Candidatus Poribacteria bacterium]